MKYLISLKHTRKLDPYFTLWRAKNAGYCMSLENAGLYETIEQGYHDGDGVLPVDAEIIDRMGGQVMYDGELKTMVPQNRYTLAELGIKQTTKGLIKLS